MRFDCDVHGDLALRVLRGEAEDRPEIRECPGCRAVTASLEAAPWAGDVADGVAEGFRAAAVPARRRRPTALAVAAAALAAAAVLAVLPRADHRSPRRAAAPSAGS